MSVHEGNHKIIYDMMGGGHLRFPAKDLGVHAITCSVAQHTQALEEALRLLLCGRHDVGEPLLRGGLLIVVEALDLPLHPLPRVATTCMCILLGLHVVAADSHIHLKSSEIGYCNDV